MIKCPYILLVLFLLSRVTLQTKIEVEYDDQLDVITLNGKMYIPTDSKVSIKSYANETPVPISSEENPCEEELITGPAVWFYIFMVLCKYKHFITV